MRTRLQATDKVGVKEACGLAGLTESLFSRRLHPRVIGATQVCEKVFAYKWSRSPLDIVGIRCQQQAEIGKWLADNGATKAQWAALDDDTNLCEPACAHTVLCALDVGLTAAQREQVDARLSGERLNVDGEVSRASVPGGNW